MNYDSISKVLDSWESARQKFGNEEEIGSKILLSLFETVPEAKAMFGLPSHAGAGNSRAFAMGLLVHGTSVVRMLDGAVSMLGPDMDMVQEILIQLSQLHGIKVEYFLLFGDSIREALSAIIGESFSKETDAAWKTFFSYLSQKYE